MLVLPSLLLATSTCTTSGQYNFHDFRSRPLPKLLPLNYFNYFLFFFFSVNHIVKKQSFRGWKLLTQFLAPGGCANISAVFMTLRQSKITLSLPNYSTLCHHAFTFASHCHKPRRSRRVETKTSSGVSGLGNTTRLSHKGFTF